VIEEGGPSLSREPQLGSDGHFLLHPLGDVDAVGRARVVSAMVEKRRAGATFVLVTHDETLIERCADEVWWLRAGSLIARGDPAEILPLYRRHCAVRLRESGLGRAVSLSPALRDGDGRAALESIELLGDGGQAATLFRSGGEMAVRVAVRFAAGIEDPVVGIMVRTRIGLNVYGTNTELERVLVGPVAGGDLVRVTFRFRCELCPGDYTITAASHDPDGVWHDWMEDAVAFAVSDARYTAGVANLRAQVYAELTRG
jgi:lipopolysaccharide transport system ATP-binding protein